MGSVRLPGKVLKKIKGKPLLAHLLERVSKARLVDQIVVATGNLPENESIIKLASSMEIKTFSGSEKDVLGRYLGAAEKFDADFVVRLTADNPLIWHEIIDGTISLMHNIGPDLVMARPVVDGSEVEVVTIAALRRCCQLAKQLEHREHVTLYMYENSSKFKIVSWKPPGIFQRPDIVVGVDTPGDLDRLRHILNHTMEDGIFPPLGKVVNFVDQDRKVNSQFYFMR
jgi:spore coat polysaccharide biosynthesis protein SpsF